MIVYSSDNIKKLFMNPYTETEYREQGTICHNKLNDITIEVKLQKDVFEKLTDGILYEDLCHYLVRTGMEEKEAEMLIKELIQKGMIE
ncbi:MAG: hypothetical protein PUD20_01225 [bacterium]|nr:hypothetical protein [bacterium]